MHEELKAIIFDMDGVLIATDEYHFLSWKKVCSKYGLTFTEGDEDQLRGLTRRKSLDVLLKGKSIPPEQFDEILEMKNRLFLDSLEEIGPRDIQSGVLELLQELRLADIRIAVASSSRNVGYVLDQLGITDFMEAIGDGNNVSKSKPEPDVFLYAASRLNLEPRQCLILEDSAAGVKAGRAAGMCVVGLGPTERLSEAHAVFPDLGKVKLKDLIVIHRNWCYQQTLSSA